MADRSNNVTGTMIVGYVYFLTLLASTLSDPIGLKTCNVYSKPNKAGVCGRTLDEALKLICGPGNFRGVGKRSTSVPIKDTNLRDMRVSDYLALTKQTAQLTEPQDSGEYDNIMIQRSTATNFLNKRVPFKMSGVACECCYHSCSLHEMAGYCEDRSLLFIR